MQCRIFRSREPAIRSQSFYAELVSSSVNNEPTLVEMLKRVQHKKDFRYYQG